MRVAMLIHNVCNGSAYVKVAEMAEAVAARGHRVTLVSTSPTRLLRFQRRVQANVEYLEAPDLLWGPLRQGADPINGIRRILRLRAEAFDIVHAIDCRPAVLLPALYFRHVQQRPLVLSWWDWFGKGGTMVGRSSRLYQDTFGHLETWFEEAFRHHAHSATVVSQALFRRLSSMGYDPTRILIQRPGCFVSRYVPFGWGNPQRELRRGLGLPEDDPIQVYVGALNRFDLKLLLDSLELLRQRRALPLTVLVGEHDVSPLDAKRLRVRTTGRLESFSDMLRHVGAADQALLPLQLTTANMARWPSKMGDYFCCGRAIVATPATDLPDVFAEHDIGVLAHDDSPAAFADAMESALSDICATRARGDNARRFAEAVLDWDSIAGQLIEWYDTTASAFYSR
ncbi:glycosyltransferase family 4 protein [Candidatus Poribacteria bacterium]|nr:glycosyltransferase family 4 protein [Candidatus Poribacteria bacterium]